MVSYNSLTPIGSYSTHENSPRNSLDFAASPARFGWPASSRHTGMHQCFYTRIIIIIIIIIIWFGDTVTVSHPTKCNTYSKVRALS